MEGTEKLLLKGFDNINSVHIPTIFEYRADIIRKIPNTDVDELIKVLELCYQLFYVEQQ